MIRGKKNFLPPCHLILGLSIMFKLEESSVARHAGERCVRAFDNDSNKKYGLDTESVLSEDLKEETQDDAQEDSDSSDSDAGPSRFPDTHIKIGSLSTQVSTDSHAEKTSNAAEEEEGAIIHAAPQQVPRKNRVLQKAKADGKKKQQAPKPEKIEKEIENSNDKSKQGQLKRGQKSKLKKIKEKYRDQDEEEKQMRMEILKSAGNKKADAAKDKQKDDPVQLQPKPDRGDDSARKQKQAEKSAAEQTADLDEVNEDENVGDGNDTDMLNTLTGCPSDEDELLFALPVVAPYNALQTYK